MLCPTIMSNTSIRSVRELIDMAFGEADGNVVNFKVIQTVLYLLARQLRVLGRHVEVENDPALGVTPHTTISVTEVKMQAVVPKKKKKAKLTGFETSSLKDGTEKPFKKHAVREQLAIDTMVPVKTTDSPNIFGHRLSIHNGKEHLIDKTFKKESDPSDGLEEKDHSRLLEVIEEQRERELRVIRQRADSREEASKSPTPMASLESIEMQYEKLLVVERLPYDKIKTVEGQRVDGNKRQLSVVTQEQFQALAESVHKLQNQFSGTGSADFPDNIRLMKELRKGASLTDAMAALQMSARLDAAEKTLKHMLSLVTDLARTTPGIDISLNMKEQEESKASEGDKIAQLGTKKNLKTTSNKKKRPTTPKSIPGDTSTFKTTDSTTEKDMNEFKEDDNANNSKNWTTSIELNRTLQELQADILKEVMTVTDASTESASNALKIAKKLERKLADTTHLESRMKDLEILVSNYADQINNLDTGLSAQMTNYQEQLTQMQHDLEIGLENMAEALTNAGGDTAAMAELNTNFTYLQEDFDRTIMKQKELKEVQSSFQLDLKALWEQIEKLRETKPDREEISDAFRDKADLRSLNGLVTLQHFDAVRGNFEKNIGAAYEKFNNQELVWQKAIDDVFRELNEKIEWNQFDSLREDVNRNLEMLNRRTQAIMNILGEPRAAATARKLFRDTACLSCASPANMDITQADTIPVVPALPQTSTKQKSSKNETTTPKEDGDHNVCYPGRSITHEIDPRAQFCRRYCGGGGSVIRPTTKYISKMPPLHITTTGIGTDGKTYIIEDREQPCVPCNIDNTTTTEPLKSDQAPEYVEIHTFEATAVVPKDATSCKCEEKEDSIPATPILPLDYD